MAEAFRWTVTRTVTATATVSLHGNHYDVDPALVGCRVELRYDPTDLSGVAVFYRDQPAGQATPQHIRAHVDPKLGHLARPEPGAATGINYLDAVKADHADQLRHGLTYRPPDHPEPDPEPESESDDADEEGLR